MREPQRYVSQIKVCSYCLASNNNCQFKYLDNNDEDQPRYMCLQPNCRRNFTFSLKYNLKKGRTHNNKRDEDPDELRGLHRQCPHCSEAKNTGYIYYNDNRSGSNFTQPRFQCLVCNKFFQMHLITNGTSKSYLVHTGSTVTSNTKAIKPQQPEIIPQQRSQPGTKLSTMDENLDIFDGALTGMILSESPVDLLSNIQSFMFDSDEMLSHLEDLDLHADLKWLGDQGNIENVVHTRTVTPEAQSIKLPRPSEMIPEAGSQLNTELNMDEDVDIYDVDGAILGNIGLCKAPENLLWSIEDMVPIERSTDHDWLQTMVEQYYEVTSSFFPIPDDDVESVCENDYMVHAEGQLSKIDAEVAMVNQSGVNHSVYNEEMVATTTVFHIPNFAENIRDMLSMEDYEDNNFGIEDYPCPWNWGLDCSTGHLVD